MVTTEIENVTNLINQCRTNIENTQQQQKKKKLVGAMNTKESRNIKKIKINLLS